jgi:hypothetical protein
MTAVETKAEERLVRHSDAYWSVTFDLPRLNIFGPANIPRLRGRGKSAGSAARSGQRQR